MTERLPTLRSVALLAFATLLGACGGGEIEEKNFAERYASAFCSQERQCARGTWLNRYYDQADCRATWERNLEELVDLYDDLDCDYSKKQAADTYDDLASMDCEEFYESYIDPDQDEPSPLDEIWDLEDCGSNNPPTYFPPGSSQ